MPRIELRPLSIEVAEPLLTMINKAGRFDRFPQVFTMDELVAEFAEPHFVAVEDGRVAYLDGALAGWSRVWHRPSDDRLERAYVFGTVDPAKRENGVGRALLTWGRDRAIERLRARSNDLPKFVRIDASEHIHAAHRLYHALGFRPVRWFEDLVRPLDDPPALFQPAGVELIRWPSDRVEELRQVRNQAFDDHWGSTGMSPEAWSHFLAGHGIRTDLSLAAVDEASGRIVGLAVNANYPDDEELLGRREGWIETVGTLASWRGRGVASALISSSISAFGAAGFTHAALNVDSASPTGAAGLYRKLGFEPTQRSITHEIAL